MIGGASEVAGATDFEKDFDLTESEWKHGGRPAQDPTVIPQDRRARNCFQARPEQRQYAAVRTYRKPER
jgi:hypothetical protein